MPREVHEHWAVDPDEPENSERQVLTGITVITRESPWDDTSRARAIALTEYEDGLCSCGCGLPREIAHEKQPFVVHKATCYAGRAIEQQRRKEQESHKEDPAWGDGIRYFAVPATKEEVDDKTRR